MSEEKATKETAKSAEIDKELSELLDSALDDFPKKEAADKKDGVTETKGVVKQDGAEGAAPEEQEWSEEFIREAALQFESNISRLLGDAEGNPLSPEQLQQSFQKMAEAAQQVLANPSEISGDSPTDFSATITQTLQGLRDGTDNLQNPFSEQDLMNMFNTEGEQNGFLPFMQGMMQSLLSKEVLYPSLKDILEKYPDWLRQNAGALSAEDKQRYEGQQKLMEDVCKELETENEADEAEVKRQRFEKVLGLMQKLQDYGQPPTELVGNVGPGVQFDAQEKYLCKFCAKSFTFKPALEVHVKRCRFNPERDAERTESRGAQEKRLKCTECNFQTDYIMSIKYHMLKHSGERPFKCTFCTYATIHNSALRRHIRLKHSK